MTRIYLDNNATTETRPEVVEAMLPFLSGSAANASSLHREGRHARRAVESARELIAQLIDAKPQQIVFTSGGTEANNQAIFSRAGEPPARLVTSTIEHPSVQACFDQCAHRGFQVDRLPVDHAGVVAGDAVQRALDAQPRLVSIMLANNETGAIQPIGEFAAAARDAHADFHTDAVQAVGKIPLSFRSLGATSLSLSGHKFHGPPGIGALVVESTARLAPLLRGGQQEAGLRAGTEPVALIVGMAKALQLALEQLSVHADKTRRLRDQFTNALLQRAKPAIVNGPEDRLPNTVNLLFPGLDAQAAIVALDLEGLACSTGSACSSGAPTPSPTLLAMGLSTELARSSIRFSLSRFTTEQEIGRAIDIVSGVVQRLRNGTRRTRGEAS